MAMKTEEAKATIETNDGESQKKTLSTEKQKRYQEETTNIVDKMPFTIQIF